MTKRLHNDYEQLRRRPNLAWAARSSAFIIYQQGLAHWIGQYRSSPDADPAFESVEQPCLSSAPGVARLTVEHPQPDAHLVAEILPVWVDMVCAHLPEIRL